jgi:ParB-like chromosome segregation protein Spo0J
MPLDIDWTNPDPEYLDQLGPHPYAELIPEMSPDELMALKADVQANGLLEPIVI